MSPISCFVISVAILAIVFRLCHAGIRSLRERIRRDLAPWHDRWEIRRCRFLIALLVVAMVTCATVFFGLCLFWALAWLAR